MGCEQLDKDGKCKADPEHRRCLDVPDEICTKNFKYKQVGQMKLGCSGDVSEDCCPNCGECDEVTRYVSGLNACRKCGKVWRRR